jgi:hypothetical protein
MTKHYTGDDIALSPVGIEYVKGLNQEVSDEHASILVVGYEQFLLAHQIREERPRLNLSVLLDATYSAIQWSLYTFDITELKDASV